MNRTDVLDLKFNLKVTKVYLISLFLFQGIGIDLLFKTPRPTFLVVTSFFLSAIFPFFFGIYINNLLGGKE